MKSALSTLRSKKPGEFGNLGIVEWKEGLKRQRVVLTDVTVDEKMLERLSKGFHRGDLIIDGSTEPTVMWIYCVPSLFNRIFRKMKRGWLNIGTVPR